MEDKNQKDITNIGTANNVVIYNGHQLEDIKSLFYFLNAKPDTQIKLLEGKKVVNVGEIRRLNELVQEKLENHSVEGSITTIKINFENAQARDYSSWGEFLRENWASINLKTQSISLHWDIIVNMPQYKIPQRHSMKLKIGRDIPPKDLFQLIMTSDDLTELKEATVDAIFKIDFVNQVLATELTNLVVNWYDGLEKVSETPAFQSFCKKYQELIVGNIANFIPLFLIGITLLYFSYFLKEDLNHTLTAMSLLWILLAFLTMFIFSGVIAKLTARGIDKIFDKYQTYSQFIISRGDENSHKRIQQENSKVSENLFWKLLITIIGAIVSVLGRFFLEH